MNKISLNIFPSTPRIGQVNIPKCNNSDLPSINVSSDGIKKNVNVEISEDGQRRLSISKKENRRYIPR